ncbi:hypothetical protein L484_022754 [Morus notabilis]|uniref:Uncharacterized protein n=1 Tax=Morus notabilis TaxID=981085 RepID=W9SCK6_9ROSA|nr:hypothetical protein L484_022754 [Morus notabilis]
MGYEFGGEGEEARRRVGHWSKVQKLKSTMVGLDVCRWVRAFTVCNLFRCSLVGVETSPVVGCETHRGGRNGLTCEKIKGAKARGEV